MADMHYRTDWFPLHDLGVPTKELPKDTIRLVLHEPEKIFLQAKLTIYLVRNFQNKRQWTLEHGIQDFYHFIKWVNTRQVFYGDGPVYQRLQSDWAPLQLGLVYRFLEAGTDKPYSICQTLESWPLPTSSFATAPTGTLSAKPPKNSLRC